MARRPASKTSRQRSHRSDLLIRWLGSLPVAVGVLITIALVLAWGTLYEARFGTAAVQRFVYASWWFQGLLAFLAVNLAAAALERYPWKRSQAPFLLAHIGIILILAGGIIGGRLGIQGQLIIPEGEVERTLLMPGHVLTVHEPNPGLTHILPTRFESQAWIERPNARYAVPLEGRTLQLAVDRYYPDAEVQETVSGDGPEDFPAVRVLISHQEQQAAFWLLARDPERFGAGWGDAHVLFLSPATEDDAQAWLEPGQPPTHPRGLVRLTLPGSDRVHEVPVPEELGQTLLVTGTPYRLTFRDYFPDFAITEQGPVSRSSQPNNPAVSFVLEGPEGTDSYLLFARHPEMATLHGWSHTIKAEAGYEHAADPSLPPNTIGLIRRPRGALAAVLIGPEAHQRDTIAQLELGATYTHPWLGYAFQVSDYYPKARVAHEVIKRGGEVKAQALHVALGDGAHAAEGWLGTGGPEEFQLGAKPLVLEYREPRRELPFTVKLLDFRKTTYPGTEMAAAFESDVELTDAQRGIMLMRTIKMNHPLKYRGYSLFQASFVDGPVETTVLSVRNDPGTPFVYAGFLIVISGVVSLFVMRPRLKEART